jgi:hypothetical protein
LDGGHCRAIQPELETEVNFMESDWSYEIALAVTIVVGNLFVFLGAIELGVL